MVEWGGGEWSGDEGGAAGGGDEEEGRWVEAAEDGLDAGEDLDFGDALDDPAGAAGVGVDAAERRPEDDAQAGVLGCVGKGELEDGLAFDAEGGSGQGAAEQRLDGGEAVGVEGRVGVGWHGTVWRQTAGEGSRDGGRRMRAEG